MSLFFRDNASIFEKIYTVFLLVWMSLSIFGLRHNFKTYYGFSYAVLVISVIFSIFLLLPVFLDKHPRNGLVLLSGRKKLKASLVFFILYFSFTWASIGLGLPAIYTLLWGDNVTEVVTVANLYGSRVKGCDPRIRISEHRDTYCIDRSIFSTLSKGDRLYLYGRKSKFGIMVDGFSKL